MFSTSVFGSYFKVTFKRLVVVFLEQASRRIYNKTPSVFSNKKL